MRNPAILNLIKVVHENYSHIQDLETLGNILKEAGKLQEAEVVFTTQNSHYDYHLYTMEYQNPLNHIDVILDTNSVRAM